MILMPARYDDLGRLILTDGDERKIARAQVRYDGTATLKPGYVHVMGLADSSERAVLRRLHRFHTEQSRNPAFGILRQRLVRPERHGPLRSALYTVSTVYVI